MAALVSIAMPPSPSQHRTGGSLLDTVLGAVLDELAATAPPNPSDPAAGPLVLDCGGGSGSRAVPLAVRGARVTVVDSSIDALSILARRAAEAGVAERVVGVQADVESLADRTDLAAAGSIDLVLLHGVLDATREPAAVVSAAAKAVRIGGYLSVVVPNPVAAVLARALAGDLSSALTELASLDSIDADDVHPGEPEPTFSGDRSGGGGGSGGGDAVLGGGAVEPQTVSNGRTSALDLTGLRALVEAAGLEVRSAHGLGAFSSLVPGSVLDGQPGARAVLDELDRRGAERSPYREIAGRLHLLARRATLPSTAETS